MQDLLKIPLANPLHPCAVIEATVQRSPEKAGLAALAQDSLALVRAHGHHLRGTVALHPLRPAMPSRGAKVAWLFHGWEFNTVQEAAARLVEAWPAWAEASRLQQLRVLPGAAWTSPAVPMPVQEFKQGTQAAQELCLQFETPLRWVDEQAAAKPALTAGVLLRLLSERLQELVGKHKGLLQHLSEAANQGLAVLSHYGHLEWQDPRLANGKRMASFQGALFLRHASAGLVQVLAQLSQWHLTQGRDGGGIAWRGCYRLRVQREGWLDKALLKPERMALTAHRLTSEQDVPPVFDAGGTVVPPMELAQRLIGQLQDLSYRAQPTEAFDLHRPGHNPRRVEKLALADRLAQGHALQVLSPVLERLFEPTSYGYRPGRSRLDAIEQVRAALREGFTHVVESDISQCFPSIDHQVLNALLDQLLLRSDKAMRHVLGQAIAQAWVKDGVRHPRPHGLPQGSPLSPALTNLMLTELDRSLDIKRFRYIRYADDFLVLTRSKADCTQALVHIRQVLGASHLSLAEHKTRFGPVQQGFNFLGEAFGPGSGEPNPASVAAQRKPMVITEPFLYLGVNGEALEVRRNAQQLVGVWPLRRLSEILVLERASISTALMDRCAQLDIPLAVAGGFGKRMQVLGNGQRRMHEAQLAHALWHHKLNEGERLALAKDAVDAKLNNQAQLVAQRRGQPELVQTLLDVRKQAQAASTLGALRGHEGHGAKLMFAWMQAQVVPAQRTLFQAKRRARGGPDRLNALLNFLYFLLNVRVSGMVRVLGLNPYLGWLHDGTEDYETLVYDLMEPFRPFCDRLALRLINRQELRAAQFDDSTGSFRLTREATRHVVERFEQAMGERIQGAALRELLWHQGRSLHLASQGKGNLWLYRWQAGDLPAQGHSLPMQVLDAQSQEEQPQPLAA